MTPRHTTSGQSRPWEVAKGYRYTTRQDLPLIGMDELPSTASVVLRLFGGAVGFVAGLAAIVGFVVILGALV